ncbi:MAG TPA: hypothetical protein VLE19_01140 [Pyrinomonadaceae bacterium]|nr:hypothetical protein [Pyrinomonadaceae bacterium]
MYYRAFGSLLIVFALIAGSLGVASGKSSSRTDDKRYRLEKIQPLDLAVLIQDDLVSQVSNELGVTREFIKSLPTGSRVMVGYITAGTLQVRQPFTSDLNKAATSLRIPISSTSASPFNPYVEVLEALKKFRENGSNAKVVLLVSDGLDTSRGFDATAAGQTVDLQRVINEANRRDVSIFSFYAPSVGLTSRSHLAASYGQSSLNRLANETGGKAFFQGTTGFVTFDAYFRGLRDALNRQYAKVV